MINPQLTGWFPDIHYSRSTPWVEILPSRVSVFIQFMPELSRGKAKIPPYATRLMINNGEVTIMNYNYSSTLEEAEKVAAKLADALNSAA